MAIPPLPPGVDDTPLFRTANQLHSAAIHLLRAVSTVDRKTGLSPERLSVLSILAYAGPKTVGQIADLEAVSPPAVSRILNALEEDGLVARQRMDTDRRYVRVVASKKGRRLMEDARARRLEGIAQKLDGLGDDELAALRRAAEILEGLEGSDGVG